MATNESGVMRTESSVGHTDPGTAHRSAKRVFYGCKNLVLHLHQQRGARVRGLKIEEVTLTKSAKRVLRPMLPHYKRHLRRKVQ